MKRVVLATLTVILMIVFLCLPFPAADMHIRLIFDGIEGGIYGNNCVLYYSTDASGVITGEEYLISEISEDKQVDFCLDASLKGKITNMRIDWPDEAQLICMKSIVISSAGVIQKEYDPCYFFDSENIENRNNITAIDIIKSRKRVYILTEAVDPYITLSQEIVQEMQGFFSHYRLTRFMICIFLLGCFWSWKKGPFLNTLQEEL